MIFRMMLSWVLVSFLLRGGYTVGYTGYTDDLENMDKNKK